MSAIWELPMLPTDKLVMLALADCANDEGWCWPSIATIARKSGVCERSVQRAIRRAEETKLIAKRDEVLGKGCKYLIDPRHTVTGDTQSPATHSRKTPDTQSPKPSGTIKEKEGETWAREISKLDEWKSFKAMRRQIRKPMNPTAEKRIFAKLKNLADAGYPPGAVLEQSTAHCWQGVFKIDEDDGHDRRTNRPMGRDQSPDGLSATTRAANRVFGGSAPSFGGNLPQ